MVHDLDTVRTQHTEEINAGFGSLAMSWNFYNKRHEKPTKSRESNHENCRAVRDSYHTNLRSENRIPPKIGMYLVPVLQSPPK